MLVALAVAVALEAPVEVDAVVAIFLFFLFSFPFLVGGFLFHTFAPPPRPSPGDLRKGLLFFFCTGALSCKTNVPSVGGSFNHAKKPVMGDGDRVVAEIKLGEMGRSFWII